MSYSLLVYIDTPGMGCTFEVEEWPPEQAPLGSNWHMTSGEYASPEEAREAGRKWMEEMRKEGYKPCGAWNASRY